MSQVHSVCAEKHRNCTGYTMLRPEQWTHTQCISKGDGQRVIIVTIDVQSKLFLAPQKYSRTWTYSFIMFISLFVMFSTVLSLLLLPLPAVAAAIWADGVNWYEWRVYDNSLFRHNPYIRIETQRVCVCVCSPRLCCFGEYEKSFCGHAHIGCLSTIPFMPMHFVGCQENSMMMLLLLLYLTVPSSRPVHENRTQTELATTTKKSYACLRLSNDVMSIWMADFQHS